MSFGPCSQEEFCITNVSACYAEFTDGLNVPRISQYF